MGFAPSKSALRPIRSSTCVFAVAKSGQSSKALGTGGMGEKLPVRFQDDVLRNRYMVNEANWGSGPFEHRVKGGALFTRILCGT